MIGMTYNPNIETAASLNRNIDIILEKDKRFYDTTLPSNNNDKIELVTRESEHGNAVAAQHERYHYHDGLKAGENTLNAHLCRVLLRNIVKDNGKYRDRSFVDDLINYMNNRQDKDAYLEIYLRRFFENYSNGNDPMQCSALQQDIWSIGSHGGMQRPLLLSLLNYKNIYKAVGISISHQNITHRSENISSSLSFLIPILLNVINGKKSLKEEIMDNKLLYPANIAGNRLFEKYKNANGPFNIDKDEMYDLHTTYNLRNGPFNAVNIDKSKNMDDAIAEIGTACYPEQGLPLMFYIMVHCGFDFKKSLLLNANCGGDNVGRGLVLGLLLGSMIDDENSINYQQLQQLKQGLKDYKEIETEINNFVDCVTNSNFVSKL